MQAQREASQQMEPDTHMKLGGVLNLSIVLEKLR